MTLEERNNLEVGTHYFKVIDDSPESGRDVLGYYSTKKEAIKAIRNFIRNEVDCYYNEEFDICEYEVVDRGDGRFHGKPIKRWTNEPGFKFIEY